MSLNFGQINATLQNHELHILSHSSLVLLYVIELVIPVGFSTQKKICFVLLLPGVYNYQVEEDISKLKLCVNSLLQEYSLNVNIKDDYIHEL